MSVDKIARKSCTGCSSCCNACPKNCIVMEKDNMGFDYPVIDQTLCINCDICEKACPIMNVQNIKCTNQKVYAAWSLDKDNRYKSTSGGAFSEIAKVIIDRNGFVAGAAYDKDNLVIHSIVSTMDDLYKLRQSKYIQSNISSTYKEIKELLLGNNTVLFCGTPCQVAGLKQYLHHDYAHLYAVDFICRGVNSPKAYIEWLNEIEENNSSKVTNVWFKYKEQGWKKSPYCTRVDFANGANKVYFAHDNYFMRGYLEGNLYMRPSCGDCKYKGANRLSDITLADFWNVDEKLDDDAGTSMIIVNTSKGQELFNEITKNIYFQKRDIEEILDGNVCFNGSVWINPRSKNFFEDLSRMKFSSAVEKYTRASLYKRIILTTKKIAKKVLKK